MKSTSRLPILIAAVGLGLFLTENTMQAESNWPRFRGPDGSGHCELTDLPVEWGPKDIVWKTELDGQGHSSVCIWGDRLFVTASRKQAGDQAERLVVCLDKATGKTVWRKTVSTGPSEDVHKLNGFATPSCVSDGERVVAFFGRGGLHCLDMAGNTLWSKQLGDFPGPWGVGASPIILGDRVIQNCDAGGASSLMAFNKKTGDVIWKTDRGERPRGGWATPILIETPTRRELILNGEYGVRAYNPETGKEFWFCKSFNGRGTPTPAYGDGLLYVISGKPGDIYAVRPGGSGDVTGTHMKWHTPRRGGRDIPSPILVGKYLFVVNMQGIGTCYDTADGKLLWTERLDGAFTASPIAVGDLVYVQKEEGDTLVLKLGEKLEIVAKNLLGAGEDEVFRSTMAPSDGRIFFRSTHVVYCVGK